MFIVHNVTSRRVSLRLHPSKAAAEGTPNWRARRFARQNTFHVVVEPHRTVDLMTFGYTEKEVLSQPEVLENLRLGYFRRVKSGGGGYAENQFGLQGVVHPSQTTAVPIPELQPVVEAVEEVPVDFSPVEPVTKPESLLQPAEPAPAPVELTPPAEVPKPAEQPPTRTPFMRPKKKR